MGLEQEFLKYAYDNYSKKKYAIYLDKIEKNV